MRKTLVTMMCAALLLGACGDDDDGIPAGNVEGTVTYDGTNMGSLAVGLFANCPPQGPPAGMVMQTISAPSFPQDYTLTGAAAGDYFVVAILDVDPASPTAPGPEDKVSCSAQITLGSDEGMSMDVTITD